MKQLVLMALIVSFCSVQALADDKMVIDAVCRDAREELRDSGYGVVITSGGLMGLNLATVSIQTILGPKDLGTVSVKKILHGMEQIYIGRGFHLEIHLESFVPTPEHPSVLTLTTANKRVKIPLLCKIN